MQLRQLEHLVALAELGHFGRAAERCHITQSAFSRSIQAAEAEIGLPLFERSAPGVPCTPAGAFVVERARRLLMESRQLARDLALYREGSLGSLALGSGPYPAVSILPTVLAELRAQHPEVRLRVDVHNADTLARRLRAEEIDFYVGDLHNVALADDLVLTRVGRVRAGFYVRAGHPLLRQADLRAPALLAHGIGSVPLPAPLREPLARLFGLPAGRHLEPVLESDDLHLLRRVAESTDTVIACPDEALADAVASGRLRRLKVRGLPELAAEVAVVSLAGRSLSPLAAHAARRIAELCAAAMPRPTMSRRRPARPRP